jgi:hypothetical protein
MIKKIFVGVVLAGVFGLLILGAVNRTLAKTIDNESRTNERTLIEGYTTGNGNEGYYSQEGGGIPANDLEKGGGYRSGTYQDNSSSYPANGIGQDGQPQGSGGDGLGIGLADVKEWLSITGTVESLETDLWVVMLSDGTTLEIEGRILSYLEEQDFTVNTEDVLKLMVFVENENYEVGQIENLTSGEIAVVRDENGRPLWAGGRQGGH